MIRMRIIQDGNSRKKCMMDVLGTTVEMTTAGCGSKPGCGHLMLRLEIFCCFVLTILVPRNHYMGEEDQSRRKQADADRSPLPYDEIVGTIPTMRLLIIHSMLIIRSDCWNENYRSPRHSFLCNDTYLLFTRSTTRTTIFRTHHDQTLIISSLEGPPVDVFFDRPTLESCEDTAPKNATPTARNVRPDTANVNTNVSPANTKRPIYAKQLFEAHLPKQDSRS